MNLNINSSYDPTIENPEKKEKINQDNKNYIDETMDLKKARLDVRKSFYWDFNQWEIVSDRPELISDQSFTWVEDMDSSKEQEVNLANWEVVEKNKLFPYINRLFESNQITMESFKTILENLWNNQDISFIDNLAIDNKDKNTLKITFSSIENKDTNISNFSEKISSFEEKLDWYDLKLNEEGKFDTPILNLIGENYIDLSNNEGNDNSEIQKNLSTAIEATKNNILFEVKNIPTSSQTYIKAIENINSTELSKQIDWINSLYYLAYWNEWRYWAKKNLKLFKDKKQTKLLEEAKYLDWKINSMELSLKEAQKMSDRKKEIVLEMSELTWIKDWTKVEWWSIFQEAWKIDVHSEKDPLANLDSK